MQRLRLMFFYYPVLASFALLILAIVTGFLVGWPAVVALVCVAGVAVFISNRWTLRKTKRIADLMRRWGTRDDRERDFVALEEQYLALSENDTEPDALDASTWIDLDMDAVYGELDRTHTSPGELMLYTMLRRVVNDLESLKARNRAVCGFLNDEPLRTDVIVKLNRLGRDKQVDLTGLLWTDDTPDLGHGLLYSLLTVTAVASIVTTVFVGPAAFLFFVLPVFAINSLFSSVVIRDSILAQIRALRYLGKVIDSADGFSSIEHPDLAPWTEGIARDLPGVSGMVKRIRLLNPEGTIAADVMQQVMSHVYTFLLVEVRTFNRVMAEVRLHRTELQELVRLMGELDALQGIASFRSGLTSCCEPEFTTGRACLNIEDGWHPLTAQPVPNSLHGEGENFFITGSNMAGKSTFLRMVAINVVLAQTFNLCCARAYSGTPFRVASSITHVDDITGSASYFFTEGRRLLELIRMAENKHRPCLCFIDEMLRGTNSAERHAASLAVLRYLADAGAVVIVASHDTDLGYLLKDRYRLLHFSEAFERDQLVFDYRLKPGICASGNAIRTLGWLGFPETLVHEAREQLGLIQGQTTN